MPCVLGPGGGGAGWDGGLSARLSVSQKSRMAPLTNSLFAHIIKRGYFVISLITGIASRQGLQADGE